MFCQKLQVFKAVVLGEMDIAENPYETTCVAIRMNHNEYVSPDAIAKLRQVRITRTKYKIYYPNIIIDRH